VIRAEPWPEVWERPWPDGARSHPWIWRILGAGRNAEQSRTVVRRMRDGYPLARLHRRAPLLRWTVGVFDSTDQRVGYCRWAFMGLGPPDAFDVARADHSLACAVRRAGEAEYRVSGAGGGAWATVAVSGRGPDAACRVSIAEPAVSEGRDRVLLLSADCRWRGESGS
jgi:hypothetical protein